jgi:hypothetical protein
MASLGRSKIEKTLKGDGFVSGAPSTPSLSSPFKGAPHPTLSCLHIVKFAASRLHVLCIVAALAFRVRSAEDVSRAICLRCLWFWGSTFCCHNRSASFVLEQPLQHLEPVFVRHDGGAGFDAG